MSKGYNNNHNNHNNHRKANGKNGGKANAASKKKVYSADWDSAETEYIQPKTKPKSRESKEKIPATVKEQIDKIRERGCIIEDEDFAVQTLSDINYFRIAHYFSLFLEDNGKYREGTKFKQVMRVYDFDRRLRNLLLEVLEEIEISLRAHCSNFHALKYGALGYTNPDNFSHVHKHRVFMQKIQRLLDTNSDTDMVKHYEKKHNGEFPLWVVMELFSFGSLNLFFMDLKPADKTEIAKTHYGLTSGALERKLQMLSDLRNHCAHYHRLYDWNMGQIHSSDGTVFEYIMIMKELYRRYDKWVDGFVRQFRRLYYDYTDIVDLKMLGFPEDWLDKFSEKENS